MKPESITFNHRLIHSGLLLREIPHNSASTCIKKQRCHSSRPCRKMSCQYCVKIRRSFFIQNGISFIEKFQLDQFLTVTFKFEEHRRSYVWNDLFNMHYKIQRYFNRHPSPKYIRCLSVGLEQETPHIHLVLNQKGVDGFLKATHKITDKFEFKSKEITDPEGILGYFFDRNFVPSFIHPDRPPKVRLLSANRELKCGFPVVKKSNLIKQKYKKGKG